MLSIATKVEQIVSESPFLTEGMALGLINLSELARQLRPQLESDLWKPVGQAAVVMALRRVSERLPPPDNGASDHDRAAFGRADHAHRADDLDLPAVGQQQRMPAPAAGAGRAVPRHVRHGHARRARSAGGVQRAAAARWWRKRSHGERLLARVDNLTALTLRLNPDTQKTPGIYHAVLKKLAWDKISVVNMMCTFSELTILLEQSQTAPAFSVLSQDRRRTNVLKSGSVPDFRATPPRFQQRQRLALGIERAPSCPPGS